MAVKNYVVAASADDAMEAATTVTLADLAMNINTSTRYGGFSFDTSAAPIPQAAPIQQAIFTVTPTGTYETNHVWKGHKAVNSTQFAATASNISNRYNSAATTAAVTDSGSGSGGTRAIDVTTIVQELVNQVGWTSTSRITLMCKWAAAISGNYSLRTFDFGSGLATLVVTTADGVAVKMDYYLQMME